LFLRREARDGLGEDERRRLLLGLERALEHPVVVRRDDELEREPGEHVQKFGRLDALLDDDLPHVRHERDVPRLQLEVERDAREILDAGAAEVRVGGERRVRPHLDQLVEPGDLAIEELLEEQPRDVVAHGQAGSGVGAGTEEGHAETGLDPAHDAVPVDGRDLRLRGDA
jgi:hypothetical protein